MDVREIVVSPSIIATADSAATTRASTSKYNCQAVNLPEGGILYIPGADPVTLTAAVAYRPPCVPTNAPAIVAGAGSSTSTSTNSLTSANGTLSGVNIDESTDASTPRYSDFRDPFFASTFPLCYALASTTVVAYTLVIMLFITPRSFLDGGVVVLGRRGFTNGGSGGKSIGGRPWLQKVAALTVAISLTIATADTFRVAETQYALGIQNANKMQEEVFDGTELKVIRIISDTFLWLAQAQTLIRLFPRQREKIIIKWTAFSLITLDVIFDCLNSFLYPGTTHSFTDAIPALSYLFELALGVLYAAWVIYYSFMKKRYAYYHPRMKNICLVAALSLLAILVPVVFFVLDICKPEFTGWGDYVLWVGAAAASVIVWEWVERIEALEREEKKDGILGREVFDGDEMLDIMPADFAWPRRRRQSPKDGKDPKDSSDDGDSDDKTGQVSTVRIWPFMPVFSNRYRLRPWKRGDAEAALGTGLDRAADMPSSRVPGRDATAAGRAGEGAASAGTTGMGTSTRLQPPLWPSRPAPAATPVSRTETASADSTVYVMRYHPVSDSGHGSAVGVSQPARPVSLSRSNSTSTTNSSSQGHHPRTTVSYMSSQSESASGVVSASPPPRDDRLSVYGTASAPPVAGSSATRWRSLAHALPFRRGASSTTAEDGDYSKSASQRASPSNTEDDRMQHEDGARWDIRARLEEFAVTQAEKIRERIRPTVDTTGLPVKVIPAPQRQGTVLARVLEEEENSHQHQQQRYAEATAQAERMNSITRANGTTQSPPLDRGATGSQPSAPGEHDVWLN